MLIAENDRPFRKVNIRWIFKGGNTRWWVSQKVSTNLFFEPQMLTSSASSVLHTGMYGTKKKLKHLVENAD